MDINAASSSSHCITNSSFIRSLLRVPADKLVSFTFQPKIQLLLASANQWTQLRLLLKHIDQHLQLKSAIPVTSTAAEIWISTCYNNFTSADWKCFLPLRPQNTFNASTPIRCKKLTVEHIFLSCLQPVIFFFTLSKRNPLNFSDIWACYKFKVNDEIDFVLGLVFLFYL